MYENIMCNPALFPYFGMQQQTQQPQNQKIPRCDGEKGALSFDLAPNSSMLILDNSGTLIWAIASDGIGNKTASPYDIFPHEVKPEPDYSDLVKRIEAIERMIANASTDSAVSQQPEQNAGSQRRSDQGNHR